MPKTAKLPGIQEHDPNLRWANKTFRLTFRLWAYGGQFDAKVGGNCPAFTSLDCALSNFYDSLPESRFGAKQLTLTRADGDTLLCEDDEEREDDWLMEMLVCAELIDLQPEKREAA